MNSRIALVIKTKNITPAEMADQIGVQRSGVSHILNGRNKPSLDFVQKLLRKYPDISMNWLLFGEGPMMNPYNKNTGQYISNTPSSGRMNEEKAENQSISEEKSKEKPSQEILRDRVSGERRQASLMDLFNGPLEAADNQSDYDQEPDEEFIEPKRGVIRNEKQLDEEILLPDSESNYEAPRPVYEDKPKNRQNSRRVTKIVIFYSDKSFAEYHPE